MDKYHLSFLKRDIDKAHEDFANKKFPKSFSIDVEFISPHEEIAMTENAKRMSNEFFGVGEEKPNSPAQEGINDRKRDSSELKGNKSPRDSFGEEERRDKRYSFTVRKNTDNIISSPPSSGSGNASSLEKCYSEKFLLPRLSSTQKVDTLQRQFPLKPHIPNKNRPKHYSFATTDSGSFVDSVLNAGKEPG